MTTGAALPDLVAARYRPIRRIAGGGMGVVYEVEHTLTGQRLALKVLWSGANASPEAVARFKREVRATASLKSENVVKVTDADVAPELGGVPFLVMELLEGTDLERTAADGPLPAATVVDWLRQVARAIDEAHRLGIVHRDLKPENLFVVDGPGGKKLIKILDFGLVKMIEDGTGATSTGQILGTPKFMAREQAIAGADVTPAADRCALGLVAYRLLAGESYYQGGVMAILGQLLHEPLQPPSQRGAKLGDGFDAWFLKACHRDPEARFASAAEQIEALAAALALPTAPIAAPRPAAAPRSGRRAALAIVAATTVAIAIGVAVSAGNRAPAAEVAPVVCGLPAGGAACGACMAEACCGQAEACSRDEGCAHIDACVRACASGDAVCRTRCAAGRNAAAARLQSALTTCRGDRCADACLPARWACLGNVKWTAPAAVPSRIAITSHAACVNCGIGASATPVSAGGSALAGVRVRACSPADPPCTRPLATGETGDDGGVTLTIDTSMYGSPLALFLEYRKAGFVDTVVNLVTPPLSGDVDVGRVQMNDRKANMEPTAASLGAVYDPSRASADIYISDCNGRPAAKEVALTWLDSDAATVARAHYPYTGGAIVMNLPVSPARLTRVVAREAKTKRLIATVPVVVRPGANGDLRLAPTP
jgi:serine/threonine-protein kinase